MLGESAPRTSTAPISSARSEEQTSELQSQFHLVCRLLLEKKKQSLQLASRENSRNQMRWLAWCHTGRRLEQRAQTRRLRSQAVRSSHGRRASRARQRHQQ